jgi:hypothetical protein
MPYDVLVGRKIFWYDDGKMLMCFLTLSLHPKPLILRLFCCQDLIDKARASLVGQKIPIQRLLASSGLPSISESDEGAYANLNQVIPFCLCLINFT